LQEAKIFYDTQDSKLGNYFIDSITEEENIIVHALLHTRKNPTSIKSRLHNLN